MEIHPNEANRITEAEWSAFILRGIISTHERCHKQVTLNMDGTRYCEKEPHCAAANHDPFLEAIKFALSAVEEKIGK